MLTGISWSSAAMCSCAQVDRKKYPITGVLPAFTPTLVKLGFVTLNQVFSPRCSSGLFTPSLCMCKGHKLMPYVKCFLGSPQFTPLLECLRLRSGRSQEEENAALRCSSTGFQSCRTELIKNAIP